MLTVTRSWSIAAIRTRQLVLVYAISEIKQRVGFLGSSVQSSLRNLGAIFDVQRRLRITPCFYRLRNKLRLQVSKAEPEVAVRAFISSPYYCIYI